MMNPNDNTGHHSDAKIGHQIWNAATRSTMVEPFTRSPSRSTRGTIVEISAAAESHHHRNRGRATAPSPDLIEPEDPNREPQSLQFVATAPVFSPFAVAAPMMACSGGSCYSYVTFPISVQAFVVAFSY
ncbi:hypothetical protein DEO72_LG10g2460 [Vigna unguiculata]|uniref:Uncharacterized protein n=1 Tax=Vigna unguiculata TaxID=3917 RepID=A0A4D6NH20_VIGUN|nr:hypothetical protein DEO72_LG10g2460 [Vigna unguiculata]